jgi:transposase
MKALLADKGYDGDTPRAQIIDLGAKPVIPNKSGRVVIHPFNKRAYKGHNVIERCFCRLKDFRRIATRSPLNQREEQSTIAIEAIHGA